MKIDRYERAGKPDELVEWVEELHLSDKKHEKKSKLGCGIAFGSSVLFVVSLGVALNAEVPVVFCVTLLSVVLGLAGGYMVWKGDSGDLEDSKVALARRLMKYLSLDLPSQRRAQLTLDFKQAFIDEYLVKKAGQTSEYDQTWLAFVGTLKNAATLRISVARQVRSREGRSRSGRIKFKRKSREVISLRLKPPSGNFDESSTDIKSYGPCPDGLRLLGLSLKNGQLRAQFATDKTVTKTKKGHTWVEGEDHSLKPEPLTQALLWLFRGVQTS